MLYKSHLLCFCFFFFCRSFALSQQHGQSFATTRESVKEYVITKMVEGISSGSIILVTPERHFDDSSNELPFVHSFVLGFERFKLLYCLKVERNVIISNQVLPLYISECNVSLQPIMHDRSGNEYVVEKGEIRYLKGKDRWEVAPPYLPRIHNLPQDRIILLIVGVSNEIERETLQEPRSYWKDDPIKQVFIDASQLSLISFLRKNNIEESVTNRMFKVKCGNVFLVDCESTTQSDDKLRNANVSVEIAFGLDFINLTFREVSELVFLAYQLDGPSGTDGYEAACRRCPKLLYPVTEIRTELGRSLQKVLAKRIAAAQGGLRLGGGEP